MKVLDTIIRYFYCVMFLLSFIVAGVAVIVIKVIYHTVFMLFFYLPCKMYGILKKVMANVL